MIKNNKGSIGVFDSGFGGLTILKGIVEKLPSYHYIYLADSARTDCLKAFSIFCRELPDKRRKENANESN